MSVYLSTLSSSLGHGKSASSGEYNFCCPLCVKRIGRADTKYHLYVNPTRWKYGIQGWYYCQRCEAKGPLHRLLNKSAQLNSVSVSKWGQYVKLFRSGRSVLDVSKRDVREVDLPMDYHPIFPGTSALRYLKNRGFTRELIDEYAVGFGTQNLSEVNRDDRYRYAGSGRIIFPDYDHTGKVTYWVARTYVNHKIKYKNPPNSNADDKVYNLVRATNFSSVIITEGVMSAIASGYNAVATYGKGVTSTQVSMLADAGFDKYYVALDGDALYSNPRSKRKSPSWELAEALSRRKCSVYLVSLPYEHDPASVPCFSDYIDNAVLWNFQASMKYLVLQPPTRRKD